MPTKKDNQKTTKSATSSSEESQGFTKEERAAMKERAKELKAAARAEKSREEAEKAVLEKIAEMEEPDRSMATRLHALILASAPELMPRTWYGMPAYAKEDKVICFFQSGQKFKTRYSTLGFSDAAKLDQGALWPTAYAVMELNAEVEAKIDALVKKAVAEG